MSCYYLGFIQSEGNRVLLGQWDETMVPIAKTEEEEDL